MQIPDVHVCHRDIAEFKTSLPSPSLAHSRTAPGPKHLQLFFLRQCFWGPKIIKNRVQAKNGKYLPCGRAGKMKFGQGGPLAKACQRQLQLVGMFRPIKIGFTF